MRSEKNTINVTCMAYAVFKTQEPFHAIKRDFGGCVAVADVNPNSVEHKIIKALLTEMDDELSLEGRKAYYRLVDNFLHKKFGMRLHVKSHNLNEQFTLEYYGLPLYSKELRLELKEGCLSRYPNVSIYNQNLIKIHWLDYLKDKAQTINGKKESKEVSSSLFAFKNASVLALCLGVGVVLSGLAAAILITSLTFPAAGMLFLMSGICFSVSTYFINEIIKKTCETNTTFQENNMSLIAAKILSVKPADEVNDRKIFGIPYAPSLF